MSEHRVTVDGRDYHVKLNTATDHPFEVSLIYRDRNRFERRRRVWYWENGSPGPKMKRCIVAAQAERAAGATPG